VTDDALTLALVAELAKKTDVSWVRRPGEPRTHPVWHVWVDDAMAIVSGGEEQPFPDVADDGPVEVVMRSKDHGGRLVTWVGRAHVVRPEEAAWAAVTAALVAKRLNLHDPAGAPDRWAESSTVRRIVPTAETVESPDALSDDAHRATPLPTAATTRGALPRVLHRRVKRRPRLS
jgi:hypothetical protein